MTKIADRRPRGIRHVFIRNLELPAHIGVYRHEEGKMQPVRINVDLAVEDRIDLGDDLGKVVDYGVIEAKIRAIIAQGHVRLVETLAERIAAACFEDARVQDCPGAGGEAACPDRRRTRGRGNRAHALIYKAHGFRQGALSAPNASAHISRPCLTRRASIAC